MDAARRGGPVQILLSIAVVTVMLLCTLSIAVGLPGLWMIIAIALLLALAGQLSWKLALVATAVAAVAEVAELLVMRAFGKRFGGSRKAFWGAVVGGMAGLFAGVPIPVVGPVITAFLGTFLGAGLVTWLETRSVDRSTRVGWGLLLARTASIVLKVATAVGVTAAVGGALLLF